eukprot:m.153047 g.153047  ORF g.153047 m.153047 type:complete len:582 (+) comp38617_c3_seq5:113-1858(+)
MDLKVQGFLLFFMLRVPVCDGSTTITPSGSFVGKRGDHVSVNCTFPTTGGGVLFEYNGIDSSLLSIEKGKTSMVTVTTNSSTLTVDAVPLGENPANTGLVVQLNFNLAPDHNGSTLRCEFRSFLSSINGSESNFIELTVLYPPCCNASSPVSVNHNTTDPDPLLPLNCTEIVSSRGNLPAIVEWNVSSSNPKCIGKTQECCDEFYNIGSIGRECNDATIECMAKNDAGYTRKVFNLAVKSPPEQPENCSAKFIDRNTGTLFRWEKSTDSGGFPLIYNITVYLNGALSEMRLLNENNLDFAFSKGQMNDSLKFSVSAFNALGTGPPCVSQVNGPPAKVTNVMVTNRDISCFTLTFPSVQDAGRDDANVTKYIVYVNGNQRNFSAQPGDTQTFTICDLKANTSHEITVSAVNNFGKEGERSDLIPVLTLSPMTDEPPTTPTDKSGGLGTGAIVGIVIGVLLLVIIVIVVVVWKCYCSKKEPSEVDSEAPKPKSEKPKDVKPKKPVDPDAVMYADLDLGKAGKAPAKEASQYSEARACKTSEYADLDHTKRSAEDEKKNMKKVKKKKEEQGVSYTGVKLAEEDE